MRQYASARGFLAAASIVALGFVAAPATLPLLSDEALAQGKAAAEPKPTTTTSPDNTYGEGGSHTTASDDKFKLLGERFTDKNRVVREERGYGPDGEMTVLLYDETGKLAGSYSVAMDPPGMWTLIVTLRSGATETYRLSHDDAVKQGLDMSMNFSLTGEFPPVVKADTKLEQPQIQSKELKGPPGAEQPKTATGANGTQSAAPKTCGEIKDQQTLIAMGCDSRPAPRTTVAAPRTSAPPVTPAANRSQNDCFSDAACADQLKVQELLRERERASGAGKGGPDYPVDLPVPGGIPVFPGK